MKYQCNSIGNQVEIQYKFQWNTFVNPLEIQKNVKQKYNLKSNENLAKNLWYKITIEMSMKLNYKSIWNQVEIQ